MPSKKLLFLLLALISLSCVRARPVYIEDEKKTVETAIHLFIERYNNEQFDAIYDNANDAFKNASSKDQVIPLMKQTREQNGKILEVTDKLLKVVPGPQIQVRAIYNLKCEKGERSIWFVYLMGIDGKASLAQVQPFGSYSDISKYKNEEPK
jgi:hypothetical protein